MNNITIVEYDDKFNEQVTDLIIGIQTGEFGVDITLSDQPDLMIIPEVYQIDKGNFWTALDGESVVGTIGLLPLNNRISAIRKMFVSKEYRGTGVAKDLIDTLLTFAMQKQLRSIYLGTIDKYKAAIRFYEKNGFKRIEQDSLPTVFPVMSTDNVFFSIDI